MSAILMIDDDTELCELVAEYLAMDGFEFTAAHDGPAGLELARNGQYQLILLDIMLPGMDGLSVLKALRSSQYCPVLMLTARGDDVDRIVGLELGADDYLAKPFNPRELVARIKAILRRVELTENRQQAGDSILSLNQITLNPHNRQVTYQEQPLNLTATEFQLLEQLMQRAGEVVTKDELSRAVLGKRLQTYDRSLDMHVSNIRKKIAALTADEKIQTLRGTGYLFLQGNP
ncbi:response regulator transcription factor [Chromatiaceae bacterium AAb-1]|nr:response regulator transcription factor [Chromatiaceae bacterium AAb-1]